MWRQRAVRGFTLVEIVTACAVVGVLAGIALPGYQGQLLRSRRVDAVSALTRLQAAQERRRALLGLYSDDFDALHVGSRSAEALYALAVELTGPDSYRATATPVPGGAQAADHDCPQLVVEVRSGFAQIGPSARCWNR